VISETQSTPLIAALEQIGPHDHLCSIYENQQDHLSVAIPFIRIGLERREKCIYVADDGTIGDIGKAMQSDGIDVDRATASGALALVTKEDAYLKHGCFDPDRMFNFWKEAAQAAMNEGFSALRTTGETDWILRKFAGLERWLDYESRLTHTLTESNCFALCQYDRRKLAPEIILNVIRTHPSVIYRGTVSKNSYYVPPDELLGANRAERDVESVLANLNEHEHVESELREKQLDLLQARYTIHEQQDELKRTSSTLREKQIEVVEDTNRRKVAEEESSVLKNELAAELEAVTRLHELSTRLLTRSELQPLLEELLNATIALQKADFGSVQLYDPQTQALEIIAQRGFQQDFLDYFRSVREDGAAYGRSTQRRERIIIEDVQTDPAFEPHREIAASTGFRAVQIIPLVDRAGDLLGMLSTYFRQTHRPSERELRATDLYAIQAAQMIERQRAEAALRVSEERFRLLVEGIKDYAIFMLGTDGRVMTWNSGAERIKGYRPEEILGKSYSSFYQQADIQAGKPEQALKVAAAAGRFEDEGWRVRKDGSSFWANVVITALRDKAGKLQGFVKITGDATERKRAEEELRRSEAYLADGQRLSHTGSWAWNVFSGDLFWSDEHFRIFGLDPKAVRPSYPALLQWIHPDDRSVVQQTVDAAVGERSDYVLDCRVVRPDGMMRHIHSLGHPVFNASGDLKEYVGTVIDTTEQYQARTELAQAFEEINVLKNRLHEENVVLREEIDQRSMFEEIIGSSRAVKSVLSRVAKVAPMDCTVLITGETGTGKELIARAIHKRSNRAVRAFIGFNCAGIPPSLIAFGAFWP
jgi:PAS domain S-box-containing protein